MSEKKKTPSTSNRRGHAVKIGLLELNLMTLKSWVVRFLQLSNILSIQVTFEVSKLLLYFDRLLLSLLYRQPHFV